MEKPKRVDLTQAEADALVDRVKQNQLTASDRDLLSDVIRFMFWLQHRVLESKISLRRLKAFFGFAPKSEKKKILKNDPAGTGAEGANQNPGLTAVTAEGNETELPKLPASPETNKTKLRPVSKAPLPGHGRNSASEYTGAEKVIIKHESLQPGDLCPEGCGGKLNSYLPGVIIRITGNPIITAKKYVIEKLRCALCSMLFTAKLPEDAQKPKYDAHAKAVVAFNKYYLGMPFNRIQMSQKLMRVPLPDSTQWDLIHSLVPTVKPVFLAQSQLAAQGHQVHLDDTAVKILELIKENKAGTEDGRTGMYTSGLLFLHEKHKIYLFRSGRKHAGENLDKILEKRDSTLSPILTMSDALSSNHTDAQTIDCKCLVHGRRKFYELHPFFPEECAFIIDKLALVYQQEAKTKGMTKDERLLHHQANSAPAMEALKTEIKRKQEAKEVEPNGSLGKAYQYMLNHWGGLTQFLHIPGAPLDNNVIERALKMPIRNRKAALFFKTLHGAEVGDMLMSLMYTCAEAGGNPVDYLVALQVHAEAVKSNPFAWLPWNYQDNFTEQISKTA